MGRLIVGLVVISYAVGCGGQLQTAPVAGVITLDGKPLADATVTFTPAAAGLEAPASSARTDASGRYKLLVTATGQSGAVLGTHSVSVVANVEESDSDISDLAALDSVSSLSDTFEVKAGSNEANFDLKAAGGN
ncbi:MAG: hypothetical protein HYV60_24215 [Planctomycetia bacterium]|nr:hypothetical protein [Planctomycetia bacterium]